mmetsp:Transcript_23150/g.45558  ORF Transcript_23150/g.45558 Transcript_23150/m.45558 type:complete len:100 (-) Transcript_23150:3579-3878(-)
MHREREMPPYRLREHSSPLPFPFLQSFCGLVSRERDGRRKTDTGSCRLSFIKARRPSLQKKRKRKKARDRQTYYISADSWEEKRQQRKRQNCTSKTHEL